MSEQEWEALKKELRMIEDGHPGIYVRCCPVCIPDDGMEHLAAVIFTKGKRFPEEEEANE